LRPGHKEGLKKSESFCSATAASTRKTAKKKGPERDCPTAGVKHRKCYLGCRRREGSEPATVFKSYQTQKGEALEKGKPDLPKERAS